MGKNSIAPWHMWGDSKQVHMVSTAANAQAQSTQIARVAYGRPENWRWLAVVTILGGDSPLAVSSTLQVIVEAQTGVGRTQVTIELARFVFNYAGNPPVFDTFLNRFGKKWATEVASPPPDDTAASVFTILDHFPGQDIQIQARSLFTSLGGGGGIAGSIVDYDVTVLLVPNVHVRPEWALAPTSDATKTEADIDPYPGDEHRGK